MTTTAEQATPKFIYRCEEFVFLTRVCGLTVDQARARLGEAERGKPYTEDAARRWQAWLAANPKCELSVLRFYRVRREKR